jgi:excisionase family DNA binding protein
MRAASRQNTPDPGAESRYGPTPAAPGSGAGPPTPAQAASGEVHQWAPGHAVARSPAQPATTPHEQAVTGAHAHIGDPLARLPEMLTVKEVAAILRVGRNQLYQAVARGDLSVVRIGRTIRIPRSALLDLLATDRPRPARWPRRSDAW